MLRRFFLSQFTAATAALGIGQAATNGAPSPRFAAARHEKDDWFDQIPGRHRVVFDTWSVANFPDAIRFANNYIRVNKEEYGLSDRDLAVVMIVRHRTAPFGYSDALWAKYGKVFSERLELKQTVTANPHAAQLTALVKQGMHLGVCNLTTRSISRTIADQTGGSADEIHKELTSNALGNSHFVPAGIVAATRAQERGYSVVAIG